MSTLETFVTPNGPARITLDALEILFGVRYLRSFSVELWDGSVVRTGDKELFVLCINEPGALRSALSNEPDLAAGRAFACNRIDIRGSLECAAEALLAAVSSLTFARKVKLAALLARLPTTTPHLVREADLRGTPHSRARDREAIAFHYDLAVDFYASFLDPELVYSCAYFDDGIVALDRAQIAKLDYVLRKLRLQEDERFLDVGCGWGALVLAAARRGANCLGITLSREQCREAQRRIREAGLQDRARVEYCDYRELGTERFDKIASIGMFEHVGKERFGEYFGSIFAALQPGGLFLNHGIGIPGAAPGDGRAGGFMQRLIFPDGELVSISDGLAFAEAQGFEVRDVENLREHYVKTLRAWVSNLERNHAVASEFVGDQTVRAWLLYMAGSAQGFRSGRLDIYQSLLARPLDDGSLSLPLTRRDIYREAAPCSSQTASPAVG